MARKTPSLFDVDRGSWIVGRLLSLFPFPFPLLLCAACMTATAAVAADRVSDYPNKPVRFLLGQATGGGQDIISRALAQKLTETLGQSFIVDNRPGASGN